MRAWRLQILLTLILTLSACQSLILKPEQKVKRFWSNYGAVACYGTEPFWDVDISKDQFIYSEPKRRKYDVMWGKPSVSFIEDKYMITAENGPGTMRLEIVAKECQDGTDKENPLSAVFHLYGRELKGCCYSTQKEKSPFSVTNPEPEVTQDPDLIEGLKRIEDD